jgi:hypothetical protein
MIDYELDRANRILRVRPESSLDKKDFAELAKAVDPEIEMSGDLAGLIIDAPHFPGWDSFGSVVTHIRFVHDHHEHVKKDRGRHRLAPRRFRRASGLTLRLGGDPTVPAGQIEQAQHRIVGGV